MSQVTGVGYVGTSTQINEFICVAVRRYDVALGSRTGVVSFSIENFEFVRMVCEKLVCFSAFNFASNKRLLATDDFLHF